MKGYYAIYMNFRGHSMAHNYARAYFETKGFTVRCASEKDMESFIVSGLTEKERDEILALYPNAKAC